MYIPFLGMAEYYSLACVDRTLFSMRPRMDIWVILLSAAVRGAAASVGESGCSGVRFQFSAGVPPCLRFQTRALSTAAPRVWPWAAPMLPPSPEASSEGWGVEVSSHPGWEDGDCVKSTAQGLARASGCSVTASPAPHPSPSRQASALPVGRALGCRRGAAVLSLLLTHPQGGGSGEKQHCL